MSFKSLFLIFLAVFVLIILDIFFYPYISFSVIIFSICYLFLKKNDFILIFAIVQVILDLILLRTFSLIFFEWVIAIYLVDLIQKKYFYQDVKIFKLFTVLATFILINTSYYFIVSASGIENIFYLFSVILKLNLLYMFFAFLGLSIVSVVSNKIRERNFLRVS